MKICTVCLESKSLDDFPIRNRSLDGKALKCRQCIQQYNKLYYKKNSQKVKLLVKQYSINNLEKVKEKSKSYRQKPENKERAKLASKTYRRSAKYKLILAHRQMAYYSRTRYGAVGACTTEQLNARWEYYGHRCWICLAPAKETDHVIPVSKGGTNWPANLRPICKICNVRKGNKWPYIQTTQAVYDTLQV